jgi:hypothetical protein
VLAATGDDGTEDCYTPATDKLTSAVAAEVDYPGSDPWMTAVGGTTFSSASSQVVWNNCQGSESLTCANQGGGASGGGLSRYEQRPAFEPDLGSWAATQAHSCGTTCRGVPDISANAGLPMVYFANGTWSTGIGTSFASPLIAGLVADRDQGCAQSTGLFSEDLDELNSEGAYGTAFTDITTGDTDFTGSNAGAYAAATGADLASGVGTPIADGLTCPEVTGVGSGAIGQTVTVTGLGLEHATFNFGGTAAQVESASATTATVVVPSGAGTVSVRASSVLGSGTQTSTFTYAPTNPSNPTGVNSPHGYWLVGSDGGIFTYGAAQFFGSTGGIHLQRPVVGISPTADDNGYWLIATDGGVFAFGDAGYFGSIPGDGLAPAGTTGSGRNLNAPIVGVVPSSDGGGYFMVASDGGVFAFGDATFAGSCPGIGGCSGAAVAVMPDASGQGYWLVTATGNVYAFGDATIFGSPGPQGSPVTSAVRTPDGKGYWILLANGAVDAYGDAGNFGGPSAAALGPHEATAVFAPSDGGGLWVASANGAVFDSGDAPDDGDIAGTALNGAIIAATGF